MNTMTTTKAVTALFGMVTVLGLGAGCSSGPEAAFDGSTQYVAEADTAKSNEIAQRMWTTMTSAACWVMKGTTNNYSFSGYLQYRYVGYETTAGTLGVNSIGKFGEYDAADVVIGSSQYWIGVYDAQTLVMSSMYNGQLMTNVFIAVGPGGQCS